ncbi:MAG: UDP-N-acetylmuramate dehydrogenase [bacterium]|nr:UDP-N-acetylmuramate dehydrogenase [bacterium]
MCKKKFLNFLPKSRLLENVSLKNFTTFRIGGVSKWLAFPKSFNEVKRIINHCKKFNVSYFCLGEGSNTLFCDGGFDGVVISLKKLNKIKRKGNIISAYAGLTISEVISFAKTNSLSGLEWATGIPASVGGAVVNNAGCFGYDISQSVNRVYALKDGKIVRFWANQCDFSYRHSIFSNSLIVLKVEFKLNKESKEFIEKKIKEFITKRINLQPRGFSAGSVYKKVGSVSAGKIIDELGLKGTRVGDAIVSPKHANFIINLGNATSADVLRLMQIIEDKVKTERKIVLTREIIIIGESNENNRGLSQP